MFTQRPLPPVAMDPTGLVPVDRAQPIAGNITEPQRLAEQRVNTMPPASFRPEMVVSPNKNPVRVEDPMVRRARLREAMMLRRRGGGLLGRR